MVTTQNPIIMRINPIINAICEDNIVIWEPIDSKTISCILYITAYELKSLIVEDIQRYLYVGEFVISSKFFHFLWGSGVTLICLRRC